MTDSSPKGAEKSTPEADRPSVGSNESLGVMTPGGQLSVRTPDGFSVVVRRLSYRESCLLAGDVKNVTLPSSDAADEPHSKADPDFGQARPSKDAPSHDGDQGLQAGTPRVCNDSHSME